MSFIALKCTFRVDVHARSYRRHELTLGTGHSIFYHLQQSVESHPNYSGPQSTHVEDDSKGHRCVIIVSNHNTCLLQVLQDSK